MKNIPGNNSEWFRRRFVERLFCFGPLAWLHAPLHVQDQNTPERLLTIQPGMLPIIIAAPHGGRTAIAGLPVRRGFGVAQFATERDGNTAEIAEAVGGKINERLGARPLSRHRQVGAQESRR